MDRAHRLGQTRTVNVYRLLMAGTLEEKVMGLQQFKMDMANTVRVGGAAARCHAVCARLDLPVPAPCGRLEVA